MPREIVHWLVLRESIKKLQRAGHLEIVRILSQEKACARLGAIAHDAPYFYRYSRDEVVPRIAERWHGRDGEDTLEPITRMWEIANTSSTPPTPALTAFLFGMLTHCVTDWTFHPLIFFFTGNYYHPLHTARLRAQRQHRLFEVYLDSFFENEFSFTEPALLEDVLKSLSKQNFEDICKLLANVSHELPDPDQGRQIWAQCFKEFSFSQKVLRSESGGFIIRIINSLCAGHLGGIDSLSRWGRKKSAAVFANTLSYRNPASGAQIQSSVLELFEQAVSESVDLLVRLSTDPKSLPAGKSLAYGLPHVPVAKGTFFSETELMYQDRPNKR